MLRSMMQVYVKESNKAVDFYSKAFDAEILCRHVNQKGEVEHAELNVYGQILAVCELSENETVTGNTMQFCLHFSEGKEAVVQKIYDALKEDAEITCPFGACDWNSLLVGLIDKFGVSWCIFV